MSVFTERNHLFARKPSDAGDRFATHFDVGGQDECWEWSAARLESGYGHFWTGEKHTTAHRFAYELEHGVRLERAEHVHHTCENRGCVNPRHLLREDGSDHRYRHHLPTHCKHGHELTPDNITWVSWGKKRPVRRCRVCARDAQRRRREARR